MALFTAFLLAICVTKIYGDSDDRDHNYPDWYNKSSWSWKTDDGFRTDDECQVQACYSSSGAGGSSISSNGLCNWERLCIESQYQFDLELWELKKLCPVDLTHVPPALQTNLLYSDDCTTCPRWECDNATQSLNWTYTETYSLSMGLLPLSRTCYQCSCDRWYGASDRYDDDLMWAWNCNYASRYSLYFPDQVYDPNYECSDPTDSPTMSPTMEPTYQTDPTNQPTYDPTVMECTDGFGRDYEYGSYYWDIDSSGSSNCSTYCYCDITGTASCETGYNNIMQNDQLYYSFMSDCSDYMTECYDRTDTDAMDRLFRLYDPVNYCVDFSSRYRVDQYNCPRCGCDTSYDQREANTTFNTTIFSSFGYDWHYDYVNTSNLLTYKECTQCECNYYNGGSFWIDPLLGNFSYIADGDCNVVPGRSDNTLNIVADTDCVYEPIHCYYDYQDWEYNPRDEGGMTTCSDNGLERYCRFDSAIVTSDMSAVCAEDDSSYEYMGSWGCASSSDCWSYGGPGCYRSSVSFTVRDYDCMTDSWIKENYKMDYTYSCCNDGWNCNNNTIEYYTEDARDDTDTDTDTDTSFECEDNNRYLAEHIEFAKTCPYSRRNVYEITSNDDFIRALWCGDPLDYDSYYAAYLEEEDNTDFCELLATYWQYLTYCSCNEARIVSANLRAQNEDADEGVTIIEDDDLYYLTRGEQSSFDSSWWTTAYYLSVYAEYWQCIDLDYLNDNDATYETNPMLFRCNTSAEFVDISSSGKGGGADAGFSNKNKYGLNMFYVLFVTLCMMFNGNNKLLIITILSVISMFAMINGDASVSQNNMDWYMTNSGVVGKCEFFGQVESDNEVCEYVEYEANEYENENLDWPTLIQACPDLENAGCWTQEHGGISLDELVWNKDNDCSSCPRCPCTNNTDYHGRIKYNAKYEYDLTQSDNDLVRKECHACECEYDDAYRDFTWTCSLWDSISGGRAVNDTWYCPFTSSPTASPVESLDPLECMYGNTDFDSLTAYAFFNQPSYTHCRFMNTTIVSLEADPKVCVNEEIDDTPTWWGEQWTGPLCVALGGNGCYYAEYNLNVKQYDCALDKYVSDKYKLQSTVYCCDDGFYCNNQTFGDYGENLEVMSYLDYNNETVEVECEKSATLESYFQTMYECKDRGGGYGEFAFDDKTTRHYECGTEYRDPDNLCDSLSDIWNYNTKCDCDMAKWYQSRVNGTYDAVIDSEFYGDYLSLARNLYGWNKSLECGFKPNSHWYCSKGNQLSLNIFIVFVSIIIAILSN